MATSSPFRRFLDGQGFAVLDGGLATTLEAAGHRLDTPLWSAALLLEAPDAVRAAHDAFLRAGADCVTTAGYQASLEGFARLEIGRESALALFRRSVELAREARDAFWREGDHPEGRIEPIVAASIGPYGAFLADGSEYDGSYARDTGGVGRDALEVFHRPRLEAYADSGADVLAVETLPSLEEAEVLMELLSDVSHPGAWISFSCRDGARLWDGSRIEDAVGACRPEAGVVAVGVNCTDPAHVTELVGRMRATTRLPIVAYPNSGERYDAETSTWVGSAVGARWLGLVPEWVRAGARIVGGCCRVGPDEIRDLRRRLEAAVAQGEE
jgi:homocysteine S-methyltransferase